MNSERFKKVEEVYQAVLEVAPQKRDSFLQKVCGSDDELRREVESLLSFENDSDSLIDRPLQSLAAEMVFKTEEKDFTGEQIGHYRIISEIGRGGMGTVFLARDTDLDRPAAIKFLDRRLSRQPERLDRFLLEAKTASALNHPNIITVYEIGEIDDTHFIATEYIEGVTLRERLKEQQPLDLKFILDTAVQIASALDAAHRARIIHRDVKPDNIMVRPDGLVKVLDFGIAKLVRSRNTDLGSATDEAQTLIQNPKSKIPNPELTLPGQIIGTINYMSPEQVRGREVGAQTDIFSFGVVLYEMLTGRLPFSGETPSDIMAAILTREPDPPAVVADGERQSARLNEIVARALAKDIQERYPNAGELLADLRDLKRGVDFDREIGHSPGTGEAGRSGTMRLKAATAGEPQQKITAGIDPGFSERLLGLRALPVLVVLGLLLTAVIGYGIWHFSKTDAEPIESIAVMPFVNKAGNADTEYLSDGLTESLINSLSQLPRISVKARSSVFRYKQKEIGPQQIGSELAVEAVLLGRIAQNGDRLTLNLELVDTRNGNQIWGRQYTRDSSALVSLQSEIIRDVSDNLRAQLSLSDKQKAAKSYTSNSEAYRYYLKGRYFWNKRTPENFKRAIKEFRAAIERDPNYAPAYVGLADSYVLLENYAGTPASETLPLAKAYAERALAIDDSLAEAHASLGLVLHRFWRWKEAEKEYRRAIELNPNYASARHWYSLFLREVGRFDESLEEAKRAQEIDPLSGIILGNLGLAYIAAGDLGEAERVMKKAIELNPNFPWGHVILSLIYIRQKRFDEGLAAARKGTELAGDSSNALSVFGYANAVAGKRGAALAIARKLEEKYARQRSLGQNIARIYAGLGADEEMFLWLEKDVRTRSSFLPYIRWFPTFEPYRNDPRFKDLLKRMDISG